MMRVRQGITHCDNIGAIFRNPVVLEFVLRWHQIQKNKKLSFKISESEKPRFTPEFYEFIRETFTDRSDMESFLSFVRIQLLKDNEKYEKILETYGSDGITKALLALDALNDRLSRVEGQTVKNVFKTQIADIVLEAQKEPCHGADEEEEDYPVWPIYASIEQAIDSGLLPISPSGEILCRLTDSTRGHIVNVLGLDDVIEVDNTGAAMEEKKSSLNDGLDTREKIIARIALLERVIAYHNDYAANIDLSLEEEGFYVRCGKEYDAGLEEKDDVIEEVLGDFHFGQFLIQMKNDLETELSEIPVDDDAQIKAWEEQGLTPGISTELPETQGESVGTLKPQKGFKLRVVSG